MQGMCLKMPQTSDHYAKNWSMISNMPYLAPTTIELWHLGYPSISSNTWCACVSMKCGTIFFFFFLRLVLPNALVEVYGPFGYSIELNWYPIPSKNFIEAFHQTRGGQWIGECCYGFLFCLKYPNQAHINTHAMIIQTPYRNLK